MAKIGFNFMNHHDAFLSTSFLAHKKSAFYMQTHFSCIELNQCSNSNKFRNNNLSQTPHDYQNPHLNGLLPPPHNQVRQ